MAANVDAMLRAAIEAYKIGNKAGARVLLDKVLELDEYNEKAWMLMSSSVESPEEQRTCLENVLVINPKNEQARKAMKALGATPDTGGLSASASSSVFTDPGTGAGASRGPSVWDEDDEPPTATSNASSVGFRPSNTNEGDLDSWISGMGIGSTPKEPSLAPTPHPFSDVIFDEDEEVADVDIAFDDFDDRMDNMFSEDEFDVDQAPPARSAASSRSASPSSRQSPPPSSSLFDDDDDSSPFDDDMGGVSDDVFDEFEALLDEPDIPAPSRQPSRQSPMSPSGRPGTSPARPVTGRLSSPMGQDEDEPGEGPDAAQLFAMIPREIEVSKRLPGENEESPRALMIGVIVLVVLNLAVLGYILVG